MGGLESSSFWRLPADKAVETLLDNLFCDKLIPLFKSDNFRKFVLDTSGKANKFKAIKSRPYNYVQQHKLSNISKLRKFSVPHPKAYSDICLCIFDNWNEIQALLAQRWKNRTVNLFLLPKGGDVELTYDLWLEYGDDFEKMKDLDVNEELIDNAKLAFGKKYCAKADVANFYPSIYTHSIAWSAVGRDDAFKQRFDKNKWYNKLDTFIRKSQNEESIGLHIGPFSSNILSDIVLSSVDSFLSDHGFVFNRVIDDYKCYAESADEYRDFIIALSSALHKIKLDINSSKTFTCTLPSNHSDQWVREIRTFNFTIPKSGKITFSQVNLKELADYFDLAMQWQHKESNAAVLLFAIKRILNATFDEKAKNFFQMHCCQLIFVYPYLATLLPKILDGCSDGSFFSTYIEKIFDNSLNINEFCACSWVIYTCIKNDMLTIDVNKYIDAILDSEDCLLIWSAYAYSAPKGIDTEKIRLFTEKIVNEGREDEYWLLVYMLFYSNKVNSPINIEEFTELKNNGVTFW